MIAVCGLAWNLHEMTERWLSSVRAHAAGHDVQLYLLDNGSDDPARMGRIFQGAAARVAWRNEDNRSIYAGWNRLAQAALDDGAEIVILSNNDLVVGPGWLDAIVREVRAGGDRYFLPNGDCQDPAQLAAYRQQMEPRTVSPSRAGWCLIFPARAVPLFLPIPEELQLWYGDDYIHDTLQPLGWRCETIMDCVVHHSTSQSMIRRPGYVEIVARDKILYEAIQAARRGAPP